MAGAPPLFVYFEPLDNCTSTAQQGRLRVALSVSNLNDRPVRIVSAAPIHVPNDLRLLSARFGARPCADHASPTGASVSPAGEVVALNFAVGPGCPTDRGITVRVTFAAGRSHLYADTLVSLRQVKFHECVSA